MKPIIEFCANNAGFGTGEAIRKVREQQECDVYEYGCLTNCGTCFMFPYWSTGSRWRRRTPTSCMSGFC